jgi:hypothetical protein
MKQRRLLRALLAVLLGIGFVLSQGTWALAGTTGGLSGTVRADDGTPIAGAKVTAQAPSATVSTTTDATGHFSFLTLSPDTYTVSVEKDQYNPTSLTGIAVFADQTQTLALHMAKALTEIAHTTSRSAGNLVKPGTTSDVYSVNATTQATVQGIGGGLNLNSAYSGIYSQPGVTSFIGNMGQGQVFYIRGSSYSQVGYEFDGVPVNRAFDNYGGSTLSVIGQQQLQVYTGGSPSNGTSATLGGYINQIIKTGTYPGFGQSYLGIGTPAFYHKLSVEAGGSSPSRLFSWYAGFGGFNLDARTCDNQDCGNFDSTGVGGSLLGTQNSTYPFFSSNQFFSQGPFGPCPNGSTANVSGNNFHGFFANPPGSATPYSPGPPVCVPYGVQFAGLQSHYFEREAVFNVHFGLPHKNDGGRDDVQILYNVGFAHGAWNDSQNDLGGLGAFNRAGAYLCAPGAAQTACASSGGAAALATNEFFGFAATGGVSPFPWSDGYIYAPGTHFGANASTATVAPYYFPSSPTNRALFSSLPLDARGGIANNVGIFKIQYQKNFGSNAYARIYGYSFYSDWLQNNPNQATLFYGMGGLGWGPNSIGTGSVDAPAPDYELITHSAGGSFEYANQLNPANLVSFTANYVQASLDRFNNQTWLGNTLGTSSTNLADANGNCYSWQTGAIASCFNGGNNPLSSRGTYGNPTRGLNDAACANASLAGTPACLANASFVVTRPSGVGTTNGIIPKFTNVSLQDDWRPNDKLNLNVGVRFENYTYDLVNSNTPEFNFWFNAAQKVFCYDPVTLQPMLAPITNLTPPPAPPIQTAVGAPCPVAPSGQLGRHPDGVGSDILYTGVSPSSLSHSLWSPRLGGTYSFDPSTVLRFSAGRYSQPTPAAFEQYLNQYGNSAASGNFGHFFGLGFYTPAHDNPVQTSNNFDLSLEHQIKGTDLSFKVSPFYRYTTNQAVTISLGPNFVSAVNVGTQQSTGVEFQIQKGDFSRDGWSGFLTYTYTHAAIRYQNLPNGTNSIDILNNYITAFNGLTQSGGGSPCYNPAAQDSIGQNLGVACTNASYIRNPYYGMGRQALLDRNAWYPTYVNFPPGDPTLPAGASAISPSFFSGAIQWKHDKLAIAPNFVLAQGTQYGGPTDVIGVDPRTCAANQGTTGADTALPYASNADYYTCGASLRTATGYLAVPNPLNGNFSQVGEYRQPWQFNLGMQLRYDVSPKMTAVLNLTNLVNTCFGGSSTPWSNAFKPGSQVCGYTANAFGWTGSLPGSGFFYGASPTDSVNGTVPYSRLLNQPYITANNTGGAGLPFQAYLEFQIKL